MFETIAEGFVSRRDGLALPVAAGPRCAVTAEGEILCTFLVQSALGVNDFVPLEARSRDGGLSWSDPEPLFPHLVERSSLFCSIGAGRGGELFLYGIRIPIDRAGESFWSDATQGMKQNSLFWSRSRDSGHTWSEPAEIPMDGPGSAEAPCALAVTRSGLWLAAYSPYNTFDAAVKVDRARVAVCRSADEGRAWSHGDALRFPEPDSGGAEAWVIELGDGRLLTTAWHVDHTAQTDYPNAYAISNDQGVTWSPTRSTGTMGQSTALAALPDGRALFVYNQRKHGEAGVRLAVANPSANDFGIEHHQIAWRAKTTTQHATSGGHAEWPDFSFGEPCATLLPDGTILLVLWSIQPDGSGIRYVKLSGLE